MNLTMIVYGPMTTIERLFIKGWRDFTSIDFMYAFYSYSTVDSYSSSGYRQVLITQAHLQGQLDLNVSTAPYSVNSFSLMNDLLSCKSSYGFYSNSSTDKLNPLQISACCAWSLSFANSSVLRLMCRQHSLRLNNPRDSLGVDLGKDTPRNFMELSNPDSILPISPSTSYFICCLVLTSNSPKCRLQYSSTSSIFQSFFPFHSDGYDFKLFNVPSISWLIVWKLAMIVSRYSGFLLSYGFFIVFNIYVHMLSYLLQVRPTCSLYLECSISFIIDHKNRGIFCYIHYRNS